MENTNKDIKIKVNITISNGKKKIIDLFAGTGAFSHAFEKTGKFECVFANDMIESSKKIYDLNHSTPLTLKNLNKIDVDKEIPDHDLLCGGFPCQPFSIAGQRKGFDDVRSNVFWKILEILEKKKPSIVLLENVKNLKTHNKKNTYKVIKEKLQNLGYKIKESILDTSKITYIPQHRERLYIAGFLDESLYDKFNFDFSEIKNKNIKDFLEKDIPIKYYYTDKLKVYQKVVENVTKDIDTNTLYQYRRTIVRENKTNRCPTLTANMGSGGHNVPLLKDNIGIRKLTPRECFNLQGFPQSYKLPTDLCNSNLYKLAGNAVSVPVVQLIANKLKELI